MLTDMPLFFLSLEEDVFNYSRLYTPWFNVRPHGRMIIFMMTSIANSYLALFPGAEEGEERAPGTH